MLFNKFIEPAYAIIFKKPLLVHFYLFPSKFSPEQKSFMLKEFPFYKRLSPKKQRYFENRVKCFLERHKFLGKDIEVTAGMKFLIAGTYVMLTFGFRNYLTGLLKTIVIYPDIYFSETNGTHHKGEFNPKIKTVAFSWQHFIEGHQSINDNVNLGLHEFAHVIHLHSIKSRDVNASIFFDEFTSITKLLQDENFTKNLIEKDYFRKYAFENQYEFLAVILEHFFESPRDFENHFPDLFQKVKRMINYQ